MTSEPTTSTHGLTVLGFWLMLLAIPAGVVAAFSQGDDSAAVSEWLLAAVLGGSMLVAGAVLVGAGQTITELRARR